MELSNEIEAEKDKGYILAWNVTGDEQLQKIIKLEEELLNHGVSFDAGAGNGFREWFLDVNHEGIRIDENVGGKMTYAVKFEAPISVTQKVGEKMIELGYNISVSMDKAQWTIGKNNQSVELTSKEYD